MSVFKFSKIVNDVNSILLPLLCFGCNAHLIGGERHLCTVCRNHLPLTDYNYNEENAIDRIFYGRINIKKASSFLFFSHKGMVKNLIHFLKYKNQQEIGVFLGDWFGSLIRDNGYLKNIDLVIPVPLHPKKLKKRGYNQVSVFAKKLAFYLEAEYADNLLIKTSNTATQTAKNRLYRYFNNKDLFTVTQPELLKNKRILLVDDVITTGATMEACGKALLQYNSTELYIASMAVVP